MTTHRDLIDGLGGPHRLAARLTDIGLETKEVTARAWHMRSSIPAKYWSAVTRLAGESGVEITAEMLMNAAASVSQDAA